mgnify:CR=1 FL=1
MTVLKLVTAEPLADPAFSVVGVGAGEGGLEAFEQMLQAFAAGQRHGLRARATPGVDRHWHAVRDRLKQDLTSSWASHLI